jgi:hypothetical protein
MKHYTIQRVKDLKFYTYSGWSKYISRAELFNKSRINFILKEVKKDYPKTKLRKVEIYFKWRA